jgi:hypothetical protein
VAEQAWAASPPTKLGAGGLSSGGGTAGRGHAGHRRGELAWSHHAAAEEEASMAAGEDEKAAAKEEASMASMLQAYVFSVLEGSRECCNSFMLMLY